MGGLWNVLVLKEVPKLVIKFRAVDCDQRNLSCSGHLVVCVV